MTFSCDWERHRHGTFEVHTILELIEHLLDNDRRILRNQEKEMTDLSGLSGEIDTLDADEQANAAAAQAILALVSQLSAGQITQAQIDALKDHATTIAGNLEGVTASEVAAEPTGPSGATGA